MFDPAGTHSIRTPYSERNIEIAVALTSFDPSIDLQIDDHDLDEFLAFRSGEKIIIENR